MPLAAPYLISLCDAVANSDLSLGVVTTRLGVQSSTFKLDAATLIKSIVTFSPASESVAIEFLFELQKVSGFGDLSNVPLICGSPFSGLMTLLSLLQSCVCDLNLSLSSGLKRFWRYSVIFDEDVLKTGLQPVLDLATEYLNHLLIASMSLHLFFLTYA
jgi:hypothetical protein